MLVEWSAHATLEGRIPCFAANKTISCHHHRCVWTLTEPIMQPYLPPSFSLSVEWILVLFSSLLLLLSLFYVLFFAFDFSFCCSLKLRYFWFHRPLCCCITTTFDLLPTNLLFCSCHRWVWLSNPCCDRTCHYHSISYFCLLKFLAILIKVSKESPVSLEGVKENDKIVCWIVVFYSFVVENGRGAIVVVALWQDQWAKPLFHAGIFRKLQYMFIQSLIWELAFNHNW